jgi:hypothetical protein
MAGAAASAVSDIFVPQKYLFRPVPRLFRPQHELVAECVGISALPGASREQENFFCHSGFPLLILIFPDLILRVTGFILNRLFLKLVLAGLLFSDYFKRND